MCVRFAGEFPFQVSAMPVASAFDRQAIELRSRVSSTVVRTRWKPSVWSAWVPTIRFEPPFPLLPLPPFLSLFRALRQR